MRALRLIDDTGALLPPRPVEFHSSEIGLDAFGWNIENDLMAGALGAEIARSSGVERIALGVADYEFSAGHVGARLEDGRAISARLVIGADGRASPARRAAGLEARTHRYPQSAHSPRSPPIVAAPGLLDRFHTRGGPFVLVSLPASERRRTDRACLADVRNASAPPRGARRRSAVARDRGQARSILGAMRSRRARRFSDGATYCAEDRRHAARASRRRGACIPADRRARAQPWPPRRRGDRRRRANSARQRPRHRRTGRLGRYERARRPDILMRTGVVDGLNRALLTRFAPVASRAARGWLRSGRSDRSGALSCAKGSRPIFCAEAGLEWDARSSSLAKRP